MKGFDIIVDSQGEFAQFAMDEIKSYAWQTDPDDSSKFIEEPEEGNDHFADALRYAITTEHVYNRKFGVTSLDFDSINDKLRKSGIYFPDEDNKNGGGVGNSLP